MISERPSTGLDTRLYFAFWPLRNQRIAFLIYCNKGKCNESNTMRCSIKTVSLIGSIAATKANCVRSMESCDLFLFLHTIPYRIAKHSKCTRTCGPVSRLMHEILSFFRHQCTRGNATVFSSIKPILFSTRFHSATSQLWENAIVVFVQEHEWYLRHTIHQTQIDDGDQWNAQAVALMN